MKEQFFKGVKGAPVGVLPGVGKSGPGVIVQAESPEHLKAIKDSGYYEPTEAPKPKPAPKVTEDPTPTLAPAAALEADAEGTKTKKASDK